MSLSVDELLDLPLYRPVPLGLKEGYAVKGIMSGDHKRDMYCPDCGKHSIFTKISASVDLTPDQCRENNRFFIEMYCSRNFSHKAIFIYWARNNVLQKIGQFPSTADLTNPELNAYKKLLGPERLAELKRATGLVSFGIGVGSFVYLRRIFESILWDHKKRMEESGQNVEGFDTARIEDKINLLRSTLPPFLVENKHLYGILSKGVHELSEEECLRYFPVVYQSTLEILRQDEEIRRRQENERTIAAELQRLNSSLGVKAGPVS